MEKLRQFIAEMRKRQLSDDLIYKNLIQKGWDEQIVNEAFLPADVTIPIPDSKTINNNSSNESKNDTTTVSKAPANTANDPIKTTPNQGVASTNFLSGAQSALHHIFLWVFSIAFVINIQIIIQTIIETDFNDNYLRTLASSMSVLLITGIVYWLFYFKFMQSFKKTPDLKLRNSWTVATIVLSGLSTLGLIIGLVISLIWGTSYEIFVRILPMIIYGGIIILTYTKINFGKIESVFRYRLTTAFYPLTVLAILIISILFAGITYLNKKEDIQLKKDIAQTALKIRDYYQKKHYLPNDLSQINVSNNKISYEKIDDSTRHQTYRLCGEFKKADYEEKSYKSSYYDEYSDKEKEIYMSEYKKEDDIRNQLDANKSGKNCFKFEVRINVSNKPN